MLTNDWHFMKLMSKPKQLRYDLILRCVTLITKRGGTKAVVNMVVAYYTQVNNHNFGVKCLTMNS